MSAPLPTSSSIAQLLHRPSIAQLLPHSIEQLRCRSSTTIALSCSYSPPSVRGSTTIALSCSYSVRGSVRRSYSVRGSVRRYSSKYTAGVDNSEEADPVEEVKTDRFRLWVVKTDRLRLWMMNARLLYGYVVWLNPQLNFQFWVVIWQFIMKFGESNTVHATLLKVIENIFGTLKTYNEWRAGAGKDGESVSSKEIKKINENMEIIRKDMEGMKKTMEAMKNANKRR